MLYTRRDLPAARAFFTGALAVAGVPTEVTTDRALAYPRVLDEYAPRPFMSCSSTRTIPSKPTMAG